MLSNLRISLFAVFIVSLSVLCCSLYWGELRAEQRQELKEIREHIGARAHTLAGALAGQFDAGLRSADHTLRYLDQVYQDHPLQLAPVVRELLDGQDRDLWGSVYLRDMNGRLLFASAHNAILPPGDAGIALPERPAPLHIGVPARPAPGEEFLIPLSRVLMRDGHPVGTLTLTLRVSYFARIFATIDANAGDRLTAVRTDGRFLWRNQHLEDALHIVLPADRPLMRGQPGDSGQFRDRSSVEGIPMLFYWRRLADWPVNISVGVDEATELEVVERQLEKERMHAAIGMLVLLLFSLGIATLVMRLWHRTRQLADSELRFRTFFERNGSVMLAIDPQSGQVVESNSAAHAFYGFAGNALVGMPIDSINILPLAVVARERQQAVREERNYFEFTHKLASGELRDVEVYSTPINVGGAVRLYSIVHDVTQRRHVQRQLVNLLEFQKGILQSEVVGIVMLRDRIMTWCNPAFEKMMGYSHDQLLNQSTRLLYPDDARYEAFAEQAYPPIHSGLVYRSQIQFLRGDGTQGWFDISGAEMNSSQVESIWAFVDITANHALEQERHRLAQAVEQSPVAILVTNLRAEIEYVNEAFCSSTGYARDEAIGRNPRFLKSEALHDDTSDNMWDTLRAKRVWQGVFCNQRKDGTRFWASAKISCVFDELGQVTHYLAVMEDITERMRAEETLSEARSRLQASHDLLDQLSRYVPGAIYQYRLDPDGHDCYPYASRGLLDIFGVEPLAVQTDGTALLQVMYPDDRETVRHSLHESARTLQIWRQEYRIVRQDTGVRWLAGHATPARQADGSIIWHGIVSDVTAQKRTESTLQLAATVFSHAREGIIIADVSGVIVDVNGTFTHITGYSREEAIGCKPSILRSGLHPPDFYEALWKTLIQEDYWSGEIWNRRKDGSIYIQSLTISVVRDNAASVQNYVALFNDITQMKEHQRQLEKIAHFDALTNLPNRVLMADRLQQALSQCQRHAKALALVYLDLDGFKSINDAYGHDVGDELLVTLAQRLKTALREGDTLARIGGDEFVAVLTQLDRAQDCEPVIARLLHCAAEPVQIGARELMVSASIGVTLYPRDGVDADLLLRHADQAMYIAKHSGKNRYHMFDVDQDAAVKIHHESIERIRRALADGEFVLHYQPKVNMQTGAVVGAEALIRWQHPERGLLQPGVFLPVIENHSLSVDLGAWVIDTALAQMNQWQAQGFTIAVSVNVGARQLQSPDFVESLQRMLQKHQDVPPHCLELEVLETSALEDVVQVSKVMQACHALGVSFALDDFGTGYSSLIYLKRLPARTLKIDQSFVRDMLDDPSDCAIVEAVIGLAAAFHREVIAEGVESVAHGTLLLSMGCPLIQGYVVARPMPADALPGWAGVWHSPPEWAEAPQGVVPALL